MNKANHDDEKKVWLNDKENGVRFLGEEKGGACDKELEEDRSFRFFFFLLSMFLHPVGKHESALFFLLTSVFPSRFSLQRF